eukprot:4407502-Amphidinium_carterae.1
MSKPTTTVDEDRQTLKGNGSNLTPKHPRWVIDDAPSHYFDKLTVQIACDHAGNVMTIASTSGWLPRRGSHYIGGMR